MKTVLAALALLSAAAVLPLVGQGDTENSRRTLAGLTGVYVSVSKMTEEEQRIGLSNPQLETDVELKLREAGIRVLAKDDPNPVPGVPFLYVTVSTLKLTGLPGVYAFSVEVELIQFARLERDKSVVCLGRTWNATAVFGTVGQDKLEGGLRTTIRDLTDQFINAYLAANPK